MQLFTHHTPCTHTCVGFVSYLISIVFLPEEAQSSDSVMAYAMIDIEVALAKAVKHLGYERLSLEQHEAIMQFVAYQDAFISISTG